MDSKWAGPKEPSLERISGLGLHRLLPLGAKMLRVASALRPFERSPPSPPGSSSFLLPRRRQLRIDGNPPNRRWICALKEDDLAAMEEGGGEGGPVLLPPRSSSSLSSSLFADTDDPSPLQVSASVLLTGAISIFLFRSLRRRAKRAKEMRVRSTGSTSTNLKEEALESLKAMSTASVAPGKPPSPLQALLGGIAAGVLALILYKFATTIEASLNRQTISDNFSVRQITITIRTIINGLCYLATFVFGINAVGLVLYAGQLAIGSAMAPPSEDGGAPPAGGGEQAEIAGDGGDSSENKR
ncbi:uncharacterized protein LOC144703265 [Wolffia australiana]